jgi:hypothetical protein
MCGLDADTCDVQIAATTSMLEDSFGVFNCMSKFTNGKKTGYQCKAHSCGDVSNNIYEYWGRCLVESDTTSQFETPAAIPSKSDFVSTPWFAKHPLQTDGPGWAVAADICFDHNPGTPNRAVDSLATRLDKSLTLTIDHKVSIHLISSAVREVNPHTLYQTSISLSYFPCLRV